MIMETIITRPDNASLQTDRRIIGIASFFRKATSAAAAAAMLLAAPLSGTAFAWPFDIAEFGNDIPDYLEVLNDVAQTEYESGDLVSIDPARLLITTDYDNGGAYFLGRGVTNATAATLEYSIDGAAAEELFTVSSNVFSKDYQVPGEEFFSINNGQLAAGSALEFITSYNEGFDFSTMAGNALAYAIADSPWLLVGFETGFGDQFDDLVLAVNIGVENVAALTTAPEPSTVLILGTFLLMIVYLRNRQLTPAAKNNRA